MKKIVVSDGVGVVEIANVDDPDAYVAALGVGYTWAEFDPSGECCQDIADRFAPQYLKDIKAMDPNNLTLADLKPVVEYIQAKL